jgi:hypothetical protein
MITDLMKLQPFRISHGRFHANFNKINASPLADMDMGKFFTWLDEHKKNLAMDQKSNDVY